MSLAQPAARHQTSYPSVGRGERRHRLLIEIVLLPLFASVWQVSWLPPVLVTLLAVSTTLRALRGGKIARPTIVMILWLAVCASVWFRPVGANAALGLGLPTLVLAYTSRSLASPGRIVEALIVGVGLFAVFNVLALIAGVESPSQANRIFSYSGEASRSYAPLTRSLNEATSVVGVIFVCLAIRGREKYVRTPHKIAWSSVALAALFLMYITGSRAPFLWILAILVAVIVWRKALYAWAPYVALLAMILPLYMLPIYVAINDPSVSRERLSFFAPGSDTEELTSLSGRTLIWEEALVVFQEGSVSSQLVGYGLHGHVTSGAAAEYGADAYWIDDVTGLSLHNAWLQVLVDSGAVGAVAFLGAIMVAIRRLRSYGGLSGRTGSVLLLTLALTSATEASLAPGVAQTPWVLATVLIFACPSARSIGSDDVPVDASAAQRSWAYPIGSPSDSTKSSLATRARDTAVGW